MALVLRVVNIIIISSSSSSSSGSSAQHFAEFVVWYLPAVTNNYCIILRGRTQRRRP